MTTQVKHDRPVTSSKDKWVLELLLTRGNLRLAKQLAGVTPEDLEMGTPKETLWKALVEADPALQSKQ